MIEVAPRLYVGNQIDYEKHVKGKDGWQVLQCCKEPYHRQAVGYTSRGAPHGHAEYLYARRDNRLILNMVDVTDARYFAPVMIEAGLDFIKHMLWGTTDNVLVHCNQGGSRAPGMALLYLHRNSDRFEGLDHDAAEAAFKAVYPNYDPATGIRDYLIAHWDDDRAVAAE